jgi:hypothetical protein
MVLQAMSGMMSAQGGRSEPVANTIAIINVTTVAMLALSTLIALMYRERTGHGPARLGVAGRHGDLSAERRAGAVPRVAASQYWRPRVPGR